MRLANVLLVVLMVIAGAAQLPADQIIMDTAYPYAGSPNGSGPASQSTDVIGLYKNFDIQKIVFEIDWQNSITAELYYNYHNGTDLTLANYKPISGNNTWVGVGDLLFDLNGLYKYGVPLVNHDSLTAGNLYELSGPDGTHEKNGVYDSDHFMNGSGLYWRGDVFSGGTQQLVRIAGNAGKTLVGTGSAATVLANPAYPAEVKTTLTFTPTSMDFWNDFAVNGRLSVHFASAYCANDVINGTIYAPEPDSYFLLGAGLLILGGLVRRAERRTHRA